MNKEKIKILFITVRADFGGGPEHLFKLAKYLSNEFENYFACPDDFPYYEKYSRLAGQSRITKIPHRKISLFALLKLIYVVKKNKIRIIHSHGKGAGVYGRLISVLSGRNCIHTFHGLHIGSYGFLKRNLYLIFERALSIVTSKIIAVSQSEKELMLKNKISVSNRIELIENGVEVTEKRVNTHLSQNEKFNIITITRFDYAKNSGLLFDIALSLGSKLKTKEFVINVLGEGEGKKELKSKIENSPVRDNFVFWGAVTNPQYYLLKSHCYLSTSRWEGLPLAVLEAMAVGLPVIASNVAGNKDVVKESVNGLLYDINKPEDAADCLIKIINNSFLFSAFSKNAVDQIMKNYTLDSMVKKTENLYYSVINKRT